MDLFTKDRIKAMAQRVEAQPDALCPEA